MPTVRDILTTFGFKTNTNQVAQVNSTIDGFKARLGAVAQMGSGLRFGMSGLVGTLKGAAAAYLGFEAVKRGVFEYAEDAKRIDMVSTAMGINAESYQVWSEAAKRAGVEGTAFDGTLAKIARKAQDAKLGNQEAAMTFRRAGIEYKDSSGKLLSVEDLLGNVADTFARMPPGAERSALALKLFEESGAKMIPFLAKGRAGIAELREEMRKGGGLMTARQIADAKAFNEQWYKLKMSATGLRNAIGSTLLPVLTRLVQGLVTWLRASGAAQAFGKAIGGVAVVAAKLVAGVVQMTAALWRSSGIFRTAALAVGIYVAALNIVPLSILAIIAIIDDLYHFMKGDRNTLIGELFGEEAQQRIRDFVSVLIGVGAGAEIAFRFLLSIPGRIKQGFVDLYNWISKPPTATEGTWLGVLHALLHTIYLVAEKAAAAIQKLKDAAGFVGNKLGDALFDARNVETTARGGLRVGSFKLEKELERTAEGMTDTERASARMRDIYAPAAPRPFVPTATTGARSNTVSVGSLNVNVQGTADMRPEAMQQAVKKGAKDALAEVIRDSFNDWAEVT